MKNNALVIGFFCAAIVSACASHTERTPASAPQATLQVDAQIISPLYKNEKYFPDGTPAGERQVFLEAFNRY